ncbi:hypothetical protein KCTC52924_00976 [Arenibacter antarcticus]|uniref:Uncharacterized protein n=1 Tax=Arenibacter antarcticus TaxID=2040469 RepID=A0ABW5VAG9_9FLAO|nr:hypothetical protein [Arenibacter sp. H213]MCM4167525.1 hypothetical protein [Arenibacter sp. H213]
MENSRLKSTVFLEIKSLISESCSKNRLSRKSQNLHESIIKNHYNAVDASIDYNRNRVIMEIVMDDSYYNPQTINLSLPLLRTNMFFDNLEELLNSCLDTDNSNIAFYAQLLKTYGNKDSKLALVS